LNKSWKEKKTVGRAKKEKKASRKIYRLKKNISKLKNLP
jgi:hypothetical protein